jgi:hypothetical protein
MAAITKNRNFFKSSKFIKNPVIHVKKLIIMLIQFKFGTFWLKIEQFWPFEEISIFSNGGHLGYMMSFLAYITGFFMNFEILPILTDYAN